MRKAALTVVLALLVLYPPLYALQCFGTKTIFAFLAQDSFYYLTVARNYSHTGFTTFDGAHPTNGFHPLWQYVLIAACATVGDDQPAQLYATYLLSCLLTTGGVVLAGLAVTRLTGSALAALWLIPGIFHALFRVPLTAGMQYLYATWSSIDGMESSLSILFGGLLLFLLARDCATAGPLPTPGTVHSWSPRRCLGIGIVLAACILSRLDDVFLLPAVGLYLCLREHTWRLRIRNAILIALPAVCALTAYCAYSYHVTRMALPVSGMLKSGIHLRRHLFALLAVCFPSPAYSEPYTLQNWMAAANRMTAMILPAVLALLMLVYLWRSRKHTAVLAGPYGVWTALLLYILMKAGYNFGKVWWQSQGYWYYGLPVLVFNCLAIVILSRVLRRDRKVESRLAGRLCAMGWVALYLLSSAHVISQVSRYNDWSYVFWQERAKVAADLRTIDPQIKLIDGRDGLVAYALQLPTASFTGLNTDVGGLQAARQHKYLDYCVAGGFDVLAGIDGGYARLPIPGWRAVEIYREPKSGVAFNRLAREDAAP